MHLIQYQNSFKINGNHQNNILIVATGGIANVIMLVTTMT
jgi:hypothetical protein